MDKKQNKRIVFRLNFSWLYLLLILGLGYMLFQSSGVGPQKIEWAQLKQMVRDGDVKEILFIRNDYKGSVTMRPEALGKYADLYPQMPLSPVPAHRSR